ncbi:MAG TPA: DUF1329 domain-containing protein [Casimicrobiaceae bacterium]|nr:DUF1329 domain-containing protein [Casimicrobiaceae bacterium]
MMFRKTLIVTALAALFTNGVSAAVSADEAKQLGTTLTAVGAEKAGNKDGTIPEYAGGLTTPPAGFQAGSGIRPDPFASEKPRLTIDGKNAAQHADKLTEGTKELLKRYPTMRIDVYPTHRTAAVPKLVLENTAKNAVGAKTADGGVTLENVVAGYPFPIPKSGYEVMWNHIMNYKGLGWDAKFDSYNVDSAGVPTLSTTGEAWWSWPIYDPKKTGLINTTDPFWLVKLDYLGPPRRNGEGLLIWDTLNPIKQGRRAWQYLPGQRRVKLAPDIAYDTPNPGTAGASTYDDASLFNGAMDRFEFKLIGKKEMYVPYSNYKLTYAKSTADITKPNHLNPDFVRWELHRVWVVEGTLKPDKRHIYSKRTYYIDEDTWNAVVSDEYDGRGQLYRAGYSFQSQSYDAMAPWEDTTAYYDFSSGLYALSAITGPYFGVKYMSEPKAQTFWASEALAGAGIR